MQNTFDLAVIQDSMEESAQLTVLHPKTGEETSIVITLASPDSDKYRKLSMAMRNKNLQYATKNRGVASAERLDEDAVNLLVGATLAWAGVVENGIAVDCTPENVRRLYTTFPWLREQVDTFLGDRKNFFNS